MAGVKISFFSHNDIHSLIIGHTSMVNSHYLLRVLNENRVTGFATRQDSNQPAQLQRLASMLKRCT